MRAIAVANYVDKKRTSLPHLPADPEQTVHDALALVGRYFDPTAFRLFVRAVGFFPPGTTVELSDRQIALVTRANSSDPVRPEVRFLFGATAGMRADLTEFNVANQRFVRSVVRTVSPPLVLVPPTRNAADDASELSLRPRRRHA